MRDTYALRPTSNREEVWHGSTQRNPADLGNSELPGSDGEASCRAPWQALALGQSAGGLVAAGPPAPCPLKGVHARYEIALKNLACLVKTDKEQVNRRSGICASCAPPVPPVASRSWNALLVPRARRQCEPSDALGRPGRARAPTRA